jgi:ATP-dependent Clp protease ATP-binding subunit ClpA
MKACTPKAQLAIARATKIALEKHTTFIGVEYFVGALLEQNQELLGLNYNEIRKYIDALGVVPKSTDSMTASGALPYTPRVIRIFAAADQLARRHKRPEIGADLLLLAALQDANGNPATDILLSVGLHPATLVNRIESAINKLNQQMDKQAKSIPSDIELEHKNRADSRANKDKPDWSQLIGKTIKQVDIVSFDERGTTYFENGSVGGHGGEYRVVTLTFTDHTAFSYKA